MSHNLITMLDMIVVAYYSIYVAGFFIQDNEHIYIYGQ